MTSTYFAIVGKEDTPLYELEFSSSSRSLGKDDTDAQTLKQFILHASLDVVEELQWKDQSLFMKNIDKFNDYSISAYVTPGCVKFLILLQGDRKVDEGSMKQFFNEIHELYVKLQLNPFYEANTPITNKQFDHKARVLASRYLAK